MQAVFSFRRAPSGVPVIFRHFRRSKEGVYSIEWGDIVENEDGYIETHRGSA